MAYTTINKSSLHMNTKLYTGNGGTQSITGVGFKPDWCWFKSRGDTNSHTVFDVVRGVGKALVTNSAAVEDTQGNALTAFNTDGFSLGDGSSVNSNNQTYVSWNWKAGGSQGSSNTDGSINTTYTSVNTTAGFSISKYTGTGSAGTVGHGLGAVPQAIIIKKLNSSESWFSYHKPLGPTGRLVLNANDGIATNAGYWNSTTPTSSVFSVTDNGSNNASGDTYMAYCFAEKTGYSKFGSYTGNGNNDGPFLYTGFKPSFVLQKNYSSGNANDWTLADNKRPGYNVINDRLCPNTTAGTATNNKVDFLSNGFKCRQDQSNANGNGQTYIYLAFGQTLVGSNNVPCTAG